MLVDVSDPTMAQRVGVAEAVRKNILTARTTDAAGILGDREGGREASAEKKRCTAGSTLKKLFSN